MMGQEDFKITKEVNFKLKRNNDSFFIICLIRFYPLNKYIFTK